MRKNILLFIVFGCVGITTEIFFTAFGAIVESLKRHESMNWKLEGQSYIWMFFIYGLIAIIFPLIYKYLQKSNIFLRLAIYALMIFIVEFITGFILDVTTGQCPWLYSGPFTVCGYIQLSYVFFWMGFGFIIEKIYLFFNRLFDEI
jgi:hypothetical protein